MATRNAFVLLAAIAVGTAGIALAASMTGCEMLVQIDRGLVEAGDDADECPICSDSGGGDVEGQIQDGGVDSDAMDANPETSPADSAADSGG